VWASPALDEDAGILFVATGVGHDAVPLASVPLAQAVVALDATTLEVKDHWQNPTALTNADFGGSPLLYQAGGRRLLAVTSKDGNAYALDRDHLSAGPVWTRRLAVLDPAHPQEGGDPLAGFGSIASPALAHGLIYVGGGRTPDGQAGGVYALDPASGAVRFVHATPGAVLQAVAAVDGVLLVVSTQPAGGGSTLEVLDASSGAPLRSFDAGVLSLAAPSYASGQVLWPDASGAVRRYAVQP
jgi:outer membrane protein assembly factor BamB